MLAKMAQCSEMDISCPAMIRSQNLQAPKGLFNATHDLHDSFSMNRLILDTSITAPWNWFFGNEVENLAAVTM
jgi:hypothetical protein